MTEATAREEQATDNPVSFAQATRVWLRIGLLSFGGPAGQIALMHRELVEQRRWISETRFLHALNYCMLLPGPEAQQLAIYIGWLLHRTWGGVVAGVLFVLPGAFVILVLSMLYARYQGIAAVAALFFGLKAAVLAIVVEALIRVARRALKNSLSYGLAIIAFLSLFAFGVPFSLLVLGAGLVGYLVAKHRPDLFASGGHKASAKAPQGPAVIDQNVSEVDPSWRRALMVAGIWGSLWVAPLVPLVLLWGWDTAFVTIMTFFSQMAVVTFGGAYAVLAYVAQEAVQSLGWLQPGEMVDGLALAETTPGPLVMVLSFVGFLAAYRDPVGIDRLLAGLLGGTLATWVTFVPCFLWIFLGAPYVERARHVQAFAHALAAITAAVVGVILNLAVWFSLHVLFRQMQQVSAGGLTWDLPVLTSLDPWMAALSAIALIAVFRFHVGLAWLLSGAAIAGVAIRLL